MTKIITDTETAVNELIAGNIIALPTETVYGLGANALNQEAVLKIYIAKDRPRFNPMIVHIHDTSEIEKYGTNVPCKVYDLAEKFSPGPLTFVVKKKNLIPDIVTSGNDSVGLRIPSHPIFREVLKNAGVPVSAPSANRSGMISPTTANDVLKEIEGKINYILDGGRCEIGIESTVISFIDEPRILRHGFVTKEEIENVIGKIDERISGKIISPGLLKSHYAPSTPLYLTSRIDNFVNHNVGILDFSKYKDTKEIALNLFSDLRSLDEKGFEMIVYEKVDEHGLGVAINDRLLRASSGEAEFLNNKLIIRKRND